MKLINKLSIVNASHKRKRTNSILRVISTLLLMSGTFLSGCKKFIEVGAPVTNINQDNVYSNDATAISVLTGIYAKLGQTSAYSNKGVSSISVSSGLSSDELTPFSGASANEIAIYSNALTALNSSNVDFWSKIYPYIYTTNAAIEGVSGSTALTSSVKQQLLGEAKFMRAFFYFYLVNLYGDVPLALSTDYSINAVLTRTAKAKVYLQIITDLKDAQSLLAEGYVDGSVIKSTTARVRPNKWAATALLARAYLYSGDFINAEAQATLVINNSLIYGLPVLNTVFQNSNEAIWQLQPVNTGWNTEDAKLFILSSAPAGLNTTHPLYVSSFLLNAFEAGDNRRTTWINSYTDASGITYSYPYKYRSATNGAAVTEYLTVLRLAEQYLIRAEARAQQNNISGSVTDLNMLRIRARATPTIAVPNPLPDLLPTMSQMQTLAAVAHERQVELFTEWGHRWLDLKRTNTVDAVMTTITPLKGGTWNTTQQLYPIPILELQRNPNINQNPGF